MSKQLILVSSGGERPGQPQEGRLLQGPRYRWTLQRRIEISANNREQGPSVVAGDAAGLAM